MKRVKRVYYEITVPESKEMKWITFTLDGIEKFLNIMLMSSYEHANGLKNISIEKKKYKTAQELRELKKVSCKF